MELGYQGSIVAGWVTRVNPRLSTGLTCTVMQVFHIWWWRASLWRSKPLSWMPLQGAVQHQAVPVLPGCPRVRPWPLSHLWSCGPLGQQECLMQELQHPAGLQKGNAAAQPHTAGSWTVSVGQGVALGFCLGQASWGTAHVFCRAPSLLWNKANRSVNSKQRLLTVQIWKKIFLVVQQVIWIYFSV